MNFSTVPRLNPREGPSRRPLTRGRAYRGAEFIGAVAGDRYRIVQVLARGAHGLVFLAIDSRLADRKVVVKVLDAAAEHQRWLQRRFQQEIEILGRISHPAVAGIRDCGELHGQPYLVMDFIDGVTLRERMKSALIPRNVASIVAQIGSALRAAHIQGIIHRDLKPENIMIQPAPEDGAAEARVKLIDFGIAHMQRAEVGGTTTVLMIAGTARYMAPEQFLGIADVTSDIYALAVVCFEMLAGVTPYTASDPLKLASAQRSTPPEFILDRNDKIPAYARPLLASALAVDPERRPSDAEAFGNALRDALLRPPPGWISRMRLRFLRDVHSRVLAVSLLILLVAAALAGAAWVQNFTHIQTLRRGQRIERSDSGGILDASRRDRQRRADERWQRDRGLVVTHPFSGILFSRTNLATKTNRHAPWMDADRLGTPVGWRAVFRHRFSGGRTEICDRSYSGRRYAGPQSVDQPGVFRVAELERADPRRPARLSHL